MLNLPTAEIAVKCGAVGIVGTPQGVGGVYSTLSSPIYIILKPFTMSRKIMKTVRPMIQPPLLETRTNLSMEEAILERHKLKSLIKKELWTAFVMDQIQQRQRAVNEMIIVHAEERSPFVGSETCGDVCGKRDPDGPIPKQSVSTRP